jgi:hypothetical protein
MRATAGTPRRSILTNDRRLIARAISASLAVALSIAAFLLTRRLAGAFSAPLPTPQLLFTAAILAAWAVAVRELTSRSIVHTSLCLAVLLLIAVACSYPGTRLIDWFLWPAAMLIVAWSPTAIWQSHEPVVLRIDSTTNSEPANEENSREQILQQLTRFRTEEGHDALRGTLIAEFPVGERQLTLHVAFCPPFKRLPEVEADVADDSDASVKLTQVLHNGAQLEVRFPEPVDEPVSIALDLFAIDATTNR